VSQKVMPKVQIHVRVHPVLTSPSIVSGYSHIIVTLHVIYWFDCMPPLLLLLRALLLLHPFLLYSTFWLVAAVGYCHFVIDPL
jgi:hypothetical protein